MPDEPVPARLHSLTGLRFLLAVAVLSCHAILVASFADPGRSEVPRPMLRAGEASVAGFFVLSGFVLTWTYRKGDRARAFWRRRFWKIFPNHVVGWTIAVVFFATVTLPPTGPVQSDHPWLSGFLGFFLLQNWVPRLDIVLSYNAPAWSICCEAFFYALFPLLIVGARRIPAHRLRFAWSMLAAGILLLPLASMNIGGAQLPEMDVSERGLWFGYVLPPVRLAEFGLGIVTARLLQAGRWPRLPLPVPVVLVVAVFVAVPHLPGAYRFGPALVVPLTLLITSLALSDVQDRPSRLAHPVMLTLGEASYALYIIHLPLMLIGRNMIGYDHPVSSRGQVLFVIGSMLVAQAVALVVHRYYERPLMRRWSRPPPRGALTTPKPPSRPEERTTPGLP